MKRTAVVVLLSPPLFRKSGGKTIKAVYTKKALAKLLVIFKTKFGIVILGCYSGMTSHDLVHIAVSVEESK
jgi:hypothetical protein